MQNGIRMDGNGGGYIFSVFRSRVGLLAVPHVV